MGGVDLRTSALLSSPVLRVGHKLLAGKLSNPLNPMKKEKLTKHLLIATTFATALDLSMDSEHQVWPCCKNPKQEDLVICRGATRHASITSRQFQLSWMLRNQARTGMLTVLWLLGFMVWS